MDDIDEKQAEFKKMKRQARKDRDELATKIRDYKKQIRAIETEEKEIDAKIDLMCIAGRNEYFRGAIQQDYAAGVKELDQETAAEDDSDNFNPQEDKRDYEKVARDLKVFCVSSRAYQQLARRLKNDHAVPGFTEKEQTEVRNNVVRSVSSC